MFKIGDKVQFKGETGITDGVITDILIRTETANRRTGNKHDKRCKESVYRVYCIRSERDEYRLRAERLTLI